MHHSAPRNAARQPDGFWQRRLPALVALASLAGAGLSGCASGGAAGSREYLMASGRWDNTVIVIDVAKAIEPANDGTPNAVINRLRVTPDIDANGTVKPLIAEGQRPGPKRAFDRY